MGVAGRHERDQQTVLGLGHSQTVILINKMVDVVLGVRQILDGGTPVKRLLQVVGVAQHAHRNRLAYFVAIRTVVTGRRARLGVAADYTEGLLSVRGVIIFGPGKALGADQIQDDHGVVALGSSLVGCGGDPDRRHRDRVGQEEKADWDNHKRCASDCAVKR